jgi:LysR family transcriptional regulator, flagellar master operon regulator
LDLQLIKTFLEVSATGSFGAAAGRLYVTQSAVSLRVHRLEDQLGRPLFLRNKGGVTLTPAGREFRGFATMILRNWEQARQRVSSLDSAATSLAIGAESSLWPRFGFRWIDRLRETNPELEIKAVLAEPDGLVQMALSGEVQVMLTHGPLDRPGLHSERLIEEQLVMVCPWPDATVESVSSAYTLVDWGPEFLHFHETALPGLSSPRLTLGDGAMAAWFLRSRPCAAYIPTRLAHASLETGQLHLVQDAPAFTLASWAVWREDTDAELRAIAEKALAETLASVREDASDVLDQL